MRFVSWNVNGVRAVLKKGFEDIVCELDADIVALQETKLQEGQATLDLPQYREYWSYAEKKGYSGTAIFVALEFPKCWFVDVYTPNAQNELARIDHRMEWDDAFRDFCKGLEEGVLPAGVPVERPALGEGHVAISELPLTQPGETADPKPVVMCGDFNVAHQEIDLKNPGPNRGKAGFSDEERGKFTDLLEVGFVDSFRHLHPDVTGAYSWWSYRFKARQTNAGWRIDYFLVSDELAPKIQSACIYDEVYGSDHCPVGIELEL